MVKYVKPRVPKKKKLTFVEQLIKELTHEQYSSGTAKAAANPGINKRRGKKKK